MDLTSLSASPTSMKAFPPGRAGVLLPLTDRRTAALGVGLFTVSTPRKLRVQQAAYALVRLVGARFVPGPTISWAAPFEAETWAALVHVWTQVLGPVDAIAVYHRRQPSRGGITALLTSRGRPAAVVKVRADGAGLEREQSALTAVRQTQPTSFRAPAPLGLGRFSGGQWSLQEALFTRPHAPVTCAPPKLFDEIATALAPVVGQGRSDAMPAHGDLTPWNLRRGDHGEIVLYDWEDVCLAPAGADRAYFHATVAALGAGQMPAGGLSEETLAYWRAKVHNRPVENAQDGALATGILTALGEPTGSDAA